LDNEPEDAAIAAGAMNLWELLERGRTIPFMIGMTRPTKTPCQTARLLAWRMDPAARHSASRSHQPN